MKINSQSICLLLVLTVGMTLANTNCLVDMCRTCATKDWIECTTCEKGYYKKTFDGDEKGREYNMCWKNSTWWWHFFGALLGLLSLLALCALCYLIGSRLIQCPCIGNGSTNYKTYSPRTRYVNQTSPRESGTYVQ